MSVWDDRILELLRESDSMCLPPVRIDSSEYIRVSKPQIVRRLQRMEEYGLVDGENGYYKLTERGIGYLDEQIDVGESERVTQ